MNYWLFKSEPDTYSIDDLAAEPSGRGRWDGVRNYQARNILRDRVKKNDRVLFYHSGCRVPGIAGTARVVNSAYPDPTQFDRQSPYYDPKASPDSPRWFCVDVAFTHKFNTAISLGTLKAELRLADMVLLKQGRLSVQPVTAEQWNLILSLAKSKGRAG